MKIRREANRFVFIAMNRRTWIDEYPDCHKLRFGKWQCETLRQPVNRKTRRAICNLFFKFISVQVSKILRCTTEHHRAYSSHHTYIIQFYSLLLLRLSVRFSLIIARICRLITFIESVHFCRPRRSYITYIKERQIIDKLGKVL